ncbi:hypothetical protein MW887_008071 [Aspergillus wentii]|nr:hypothetical protein MW887_008071 [Aspergillus wentii]
MSGHCDGSIPPKPFHRHFGYLFVCLPSSFEGGNAIISSDGKSVKFEWSEQSASAVQWIAFYNNGCRLDLQAVTKGQRVILIYELYETEPSAMMILEDDPIIDPASLPLYQYISDLWTQPAFFTQGYWLGFYSNHPYAHTNFNEYDLFPRLLHGSDLGLFAVLQALGINPTILPVINSCTTPLDPVSLIADGIHNFIYVPNIRPGASWYDIVREFWPCGQSEQVCWMNEPTFRSLALTAGVNGDEYFEDSVYSSLAIFAYIPPWNERHVWG